MNPLKIATSQAHVAKYDRATRNEHRTIPSLVRTDFPSLKKIPRHDNPPVLFTNALAHEIRNPLANINLSVSVLQFSIVDEDLRSYLEIIKRSTEKINNLVIDLLKDPNIRNNSYEKHFVHELLDEVLEASSDRIRLKGIKIVKRYALHDRSFEFNRSGVKIAITNLIINAIEAIIPATGELTILTSSVDGKFVLGIRDNGCGISEANLKNIFKPYFTTKPGGLGVGLRETYDILQSNKINVKVESELGIGTCFTLIFNNVLEPNVLTTTTNV